jgi:dienelactone hydrolase
MRSILALAGLLLCGLGTPEAAAQPVRFPSVAVGNIAAGPELSGWLYRPDGAGPFPAILLAHPCNGVSAHTNVWGRLLASWGYVTVAPDSFGPRGEKTGVCGRGNIVGGNARVADVAGALDWLNAQPFVRKNDIGLIGHSHGGWTTMRAVQGNFGLAQRGLKAAVAYYPFCGAMDGDVAVPLLILIGDKDDWTPADNCRRLQAAGFKRPGLVEAIYYPKAYHSFDSPAPYRIITVADGKSHELSYDPVAAPDAEARTRAFFDKHLKQ